MISPEQLATTVVVIRLWSNGFGWSGCGVIVLESAVMIITYQWLRK